MTGASQLRSSIFAEMIPLSPGVEGNPEARVSLVLLTGGHRLCPSVERLAGPYAFLGERMLQANLLVFVGSLTVDGGGAFSP